MSFFSSKVKWLIKNARLAIDDIQQTWIDNFGPGEALSKVPEGSFTNGVAVITRNEVSDRDGTGVILGRIFQGVPGVLSIRSKDLHGEHTLGDFSICFDHQKGPRAKSYLRLTRSLDRNSFGYAVCAPSEPDDLLTALVLKDAFGAKLCVYFIDDNHMLGGGIPTDLMEEALQKADLRLATSPQMRDAYEAKFGQKFWLRPPVVTPGAICLVPRIPDKETLRKARGIIVGSLRGNQSLQRLAKAVAEAELQVDWYGNSDVSWLHYDANDLAAKGVFVRGFIPETELAEKLTQYAYAIVPSGTLEADDQRINIARYSLPTRMPFLLAVGNIPTIVLGSPQTAAGRFVERFGLGEVVPYAGDRLRFAVNQLCQPATQERIRAGAVEAAQYFSAKGVWDWMVRAMDRGKPDDESMERLMPRQTGNLGAYIGPPPPKDLLAAFAPVYQSLTRLKELEFEPEFVFDVGASTGIWSVSVSEIFPKARYLLVEPLVDRYFEGIAHLRKRLPEAEVICAAIGDHVGKGAFRVSADLYTSSLLQPADVDTRLIEVPMLTLDALAIEKKVTGRGLLKMDVQNAEHLVLAGASQTLRQVDVVIAELSLYRLADGAKTLFEMLELFQGKGFRYFDDVGEWRDPTNGILLQKDILFVSEALLEKLEL